MSGIGIITTKGNGAGHNTGGYEPGEIVDMPIRMVVEEALIEPYHLSDAQ